MDGATDFLERIVSFFSRGARWIILFGRKYPLAACIYLIGCMWVVFFLGNLSASLSPIAPTASLSPSRSVTAVTPVAPMAKAMAYRNGERVVIRWDRGVEVPQLMADGSRLTANCSSTQCMTNVSKNASQLIVTWQESGQLFRKTFRL